MAKDNPNYKSFFGTSYDNPFIDVSEIEDARRSLPDHIFRQEYLAEFLDDGSSVFRNINECIKKGGESANYYAGVDLGVPYGTCKNIDLQLTPFLAVRKIPTHHKKFANGENATQKSDYCLVSAH